MKKQTSKRTASRRSRRTGVPHHAKQLLVPHRGNQYRPHLIRRYGLIAVMIVALGIPVLINKLSDGSVLGVKQAVTPQGVFDDTNNVRRSKGLKPLVANTALSQAATDKANDMLNEEYWAHTSPSGLTPWHWFSAVGYRYSVAGENLAKNFDSNDAVVTAWMESPEHRANLLDDAYQDVGIAVAHGTMNGAPIDLIVALYARPSTGAVAAAASAKTTHASALGQPLSFTARVHMALESLAPTALLSIIVLLVAALVAGLAHGYRTKLPKKLRVSWYRHHGLYKTLGLVSLVMVVVSLYSGGQI